MVLGQPKRGAILFVSLPPQHAKQTAPIAAARREFIDQGAIGIAHRSPYLTGGSCSRGARRRRLLRSLSKNFRGLA
jgi:hypothetical protein